MRVMVVGGGIGGLGCALQLLSRGCQVTVVERQSRVIDKVCGEGLLPFGVKAMADLGLRDRLLSKGYVFKGLGYHFNGCRAEADFGSGEVGVGIERRQLDLLLRDACAAYPDFRHELGKRVKPGDDHGYDRLIAADGIHSAWAAAAGVRLNMGKRLGLRFRFYGPATERVNVHFFDFGEIYLTPVSADEISVAFLIDPARLGVGGGLIREWAADFFRKTFPQYADVEIRDMATRGPIKSAPKGPDPAVHLIGDAHRAFDPISGAGMSYALLCGGLAAQHLDDPAAYYRALEPVSRSVGAVTGLVLMFSGGGLRTRLMLNRLSRHGKVFSQLIQQHNGAWQPAGLVRPVLRLLMP